jgi:regulator of protease activity HflC (stomatin/prohibitin superfamily)
MTNIRRITWAGHLRAEPNEYILHYRKGKLAREGAGLAYWFNPLTAAVVKVPVDDCEATFIHHERSADMQNVVVQATVMYRFSRPELAANRLNFTIDLHTGAWMDQPLEKAAAFWTARTLGPVRAYLADVTLPEAVRAGAERMTNLIRASLADDPELDAMGLSVVNVQVVSVSATAELEKALQTPTRESMQQKADEAVFARRALAVENERAIRQNELATEVELAKRQEALIEQRGANHMREVQRKAEAELAQAQAAAERETLHAEAEAEQARMRAEGKAAATRLVGEANAEADRLRVEAWEGASARTQMGLAMQELARHIKTIGHLNITPNVLGEAFQKMLSEELN